MPAFCAAFPILPGKSQAARDFAKTVMTQRFKEFEASEKKLKITKEAWFHQKTPQGDMVLIYFEGADLAKAFEDFARSKDPFDVWFKEQTKAITGVDLNQPPSEPPPEKMLSYGY